MLQDFLGVLSRAKAGDQTAVTQLMTEFGDLVEQICRSAMPGPCPDLSTSDLTQEVLLKVWLRLEQFRGTPDEIEAKRMFRGWLQITARNVIRDLIGARRAKRRAPGGRQVPIVDGTPADSENPVVGYVPIAKDLTPSQIAGQAEERVKIACTIASLTDETDRKIIHSYFVEQKSMRQISKDLELSYDTIRGRFHRALDYLQRSLGELK